MEDRSRVDGAAHRAEWTRVIVLAPDAGGAGDNAGAAGHGPLESLHAEFEKRDWFAIVQPDPYQALAELALRDRAQAARAAWGLQRMEGLALLVIEPERWPADMLGDLLATVRRCLPEATLWTASDNRIEPAAHATPTAPATPAPTPNSWAALIAEHEALQRRTSNVARFSDDSTSTAHNHVAVPQSVDAEAIRDAGRLSREEIDMLLHDGELSDERRSGPEASS